MPRRLINTHASKTTVIGVEFPDDSTLDQPLSAEGGPMTLSATPTAVPGATISAPALPANRSYLITYSVELDIAAGLQTEVTGRLFDGVATNGVQTWHQNVGVSGGEGSVQECVSWTIKVAGNGSARTFGLSLADPAAVVTVPAFGCTGVIQLI